MKKHVQDGPHNLDYVKPLFECVEVTLLKPPYPSDASIFDLTDDEGARPAQSIVVNARDGKKIAALLKGKTPYNSEFLTRETEGGTLLVSVRRIRR